MSPRTCPHCSSLSRPTALFCSDCGSALLTRQATLAESKRKEDRKRERHCPFCGTLTRGLACPEHLDLVVA